MQSLSLFLITDYLTLLPEYFYTLLVCILKNEKTVPTLYTKQEHALNQTQLTHKPTRQQMTQRAL